MSLKNLIVLGTLFAAGVWSTGCNNSAGTPATKEVATDGHSHDGWWCNEHGVPEDVCALCNTKLVADFKAKGDWCKEGHERPDSQCFICHPEKEAEFAAQYEAKYGKKPPKPEAGGEKHDHEKHDHKDEVKK
jgi:cobalt-zinc-cadmium efflux system membrane fusion protein